MVNGLEPLTLVLASIVFAGAALLGGISGFGFAMLTTPLLLALGFPLAVIVPTNLLIAMLTRGVVAIRLRPYLRVRRAVLMAAASIPGVGVGLVTINLLPIMALKVTIGMLVMGLTILIWRTASRPPLRPWPGMVVVAGAFGGFLGATTSLNGIPPVLLLSREQTEPKRFQADLALFFVLSNLATLALLGWRGRWPSPDWVPMVALWLGMALVTNHLGTSLGGRLPTATFRNLALGLAFLAGLLSVLTA